MINKKDLNNFAKLLPILSVDLVIKNRNRFLLAKRNNFPAKNKYCFIGGIVQKNEKITTSIKRILIRELGIKAKKINFITFKQFSFPKDFSNLKTKINYLSLCHEVILSDKEINLITLNHENKGFILMDKKNILKKSDVLSQVKRLIKEIY